MRHLNGLGELEDEKGLDNGRSSLPRQAKLITSASSVNHLGQLSSSPWRAQQFTSTGSTAHLDGFNSSPRQALRVTSASSTLHFSELCTLHWRDHQFTSFGGWVPTCLCL
ncbi:hypothetical protein KSP39_PZI002849 [Platanthera zijinensis]|uniref:Uncharacterized protein n=1 Tax=Platanthera zijinensis TaxID=2320716 RepID=A0AAP0C0B6_9ASPA